MKHPRNVGFYYGCKNYALSFNFINNYMYQWPKWKQNLGLSAPCPVLFSSSLHFPYTLQAPIRGMFESRIFHSFNSGTEREREALLVWAWTLIRAAEILDQEPCHTWWDPVSFEVMIKDLHVSCWEVFFFFFFFMCPLLSFCSALKHLFYLHECVQQADCSLPENSSHKCK